MQVYITTVILDIEPMIDSLSKGDIYGLWALVVATALTAVSAGLSAVKTMAVDLVRKLNTES